MRLTGEKRGAFVEDGPGDAGHPARTACHENLGDPQLRQLTIFGHRPSASFVRASEVDVNDIAKLYIWHQPSRMSLDNLARVVHSQDHPIKLIALMQSVLGFWPPTSLETHNRGDGETPLRKHRS